MHKRTGFSFLEIMISVTVMTILGLMLMSAVSKRFIVGGVEDDLGGTFYCYKDANGELHSVKERTALDGTAMAPVVVNGSCRLEISGTANVSITAVGGGGAGAVVAADDIWDFNLVNMTAPDNDDDDGRDTVGVSGQNLDVIRRLDITDYGAFVRNPSPYLNEIQKLASIATLRQEDIITKNWRDNTPAGELFGFVRSCTGSGCVPQNKGGTVRLNYTKPFFFAIVIPNPLDTTVNCDINNDGICNALDDPSFFRSPLGFPELNGDIVSYRGDLNSMTASDGLVQNFLQNAIANDAYNQLVLDGYHVLVRGGDKVNPELKPTTGIGVGDPYHWADGLNTVYYDNYAVAHAGRENRVYNDIRFLPLPGQFVYIDTDTGTRVPADDTQWVKASRRSYEEFLTSYGFSVNANFSTLETSFHFPASDIAGWSWDIPEFMNRNILYDNNDTPVSADVLNSTQYDINYFWLRAASIRALGGDNGQPGEVAGPIRINNSVNYDVTIRPDEIGTGGVPNRNNGKGGDTKIETIAGTLFAEGGVGGTLIPSQNFDGFVVTDAETPMVSIGTDGRPQANMATARTVWSTTPAQQPALSSYIANMANPRYGDVSAARTSQWDSTTNEWINGSQPGEASFGAAGAGMQAGLTVDNLLGAFVYRQYRDRTIDANRNRFVSIVNEPVLERNTRHGNAVSNGGGGAIIIQWTR